MGAKAAKAAAKRAATKTRTRALPRGHVIIAGTDAERAEIRHFKLLTAVDGLTANRAMLDYIAAHNAKHKMVSTPLMTENELLAHLEAMGVGVTRNSLHGWRRAVPALKGNTPWFWKAGGSVVYRKDVVEQMARLRADDQTNTPTTELFASIKAGGKK